MTILTPHLIFNLQSRRGGFNSFVKKTLLRLTGIKDHGKRNAARWPKEIMGKKIPTHVYMDLAKNKNIHLDDLKAYTRLIHNVHIMNEVNYLND